MKTKKYKESYDYLIKSISEERNRLNEQIRILEYNNNVNHLNNALTEFFSILNYLRQDIAKANVFDEIFDFEIKKIDYQLKKYKDKSRKNKK